MKKTIAFEEVKAMNINTALTVDFGHGCYKDCTIKDYLTNYYQDSDDTWYTENGRLYVYLVD